MLIAIMIKVFNYFHISALLNLQKAILQFIKETKISKKKFTFKKIHILQDKTGCQKYQVSVTAIAKLMPANFPY